MLKRIGVVDVDPEALHMVQEEFESELRSLFRDAKPNRAKVESTARAFHRFAAESLRQAGYESSKLAVASLLGEDTAHYSQVLTGKRGSADRISRWFVIWTLTWSPLYFPPAARDVPMQRAHSLPMAEERRVLKSLKGRLPAGVTFRPT